MAPDVLPAAPRPDGLALRLQTHRHPHPAGLVLGLLLLTSIASPGSAAEPTSTTARQIEIRAGLSTQQWSQVEATIDKALAFLSRQQRSDGSFPVPSGSNRLAQPGVTALGVMAFLSRGHLPGEGPYGQAISRAIGFVLSCQQKDGLLALEHPDQARGILVAECAVYNHAIAGLMLSETYGMTTGQTNKRIRSSLEIALKIALQKHPAPKRNKLDEGGWRYRQRWQSSDSDLSVTSWYLMFLRSCRNAGLEVPAQPIDDALAYVERCYDPQQSAFWYALRGQERVRTRAMVGAGILSLSLAGKHESDMARQAGDWLLRHPFDAYKAKVTGPDRFFYGAFYCSLAAFQLGGRYWNDFYPTMARTLVSHQNRDGSWDNETKPDEEFGNAYSSALAVLALSPPYQLLPIFQR